MLDADLGFPHSYEIEEVPELPGTGISDVPLFYFPNPKARQGHDGLWLCVRAASGKSWVGVFAFGYGSPPAISRVTSTSDPDVICVISRGAAYIVKADEPDSWKEIPVRPVLDVRLVLEHQLLIFAEFTRLTAYGRDGLVWRSPRLCWDHLRILGVTLDEIKGVGYDPTNACDSYFLVDIRTGNPSFNSAKFMDINGKSLW
jgi:hypothetical protein